MGHNRLNALAMLNIYAKFISDIHDFNDHAIDKFARQKIEQ